MIRKIARRLNVDFSDDGFRELFRGSAGTFLVRMVGMLAGYAFTYLVSRLYGAEVLGAHTLSVTVLMMFTIPGRMGMDTALVRRFAADHPAGRWDRVLEAYTKTLSVVIPAGILLSVCMYVFSGILAFGVFGKPGLEPFFRTAAFGVLPMVLRFITADAYRGFRMNRHYAYTQNVSYFLYGTVILGILSVFFDDPLMPNIAFVASLCILAVSGTWMILRKIQRHASRQSEELNMMTMVQDAYPMMMAGSMLLLSGWINTLLLGIWGTEAEVGVYSVVVKISTLSSFVLLSINSVSGPGFAKLHAEKDHEGLKKYSAHTATIIFYSSVPVFIGIIVFRKWLLGLFGEEFTEGSLALLITMAGQFFNVFAGSVGQFLNMTGRQQVFMRIIVLNTALNIVCCVLLIPEFGMIGSAIAGAVFMAGWNLMSMLYISRQLGIRTYYWPFR